MVVDERRTAGGPARPPQVLRFALPEYIEEDPTLARVFSEHDADDFCQELSGRKVARADARQGVPAQAGA